MDKTKAAHDQLSFPELKVYLARDIEEFALLSDIALLLLKSSIYFLGVRALFMVIHQIVIKLIWLIFSSLT